MAKLNDIIKGLLHPFDEEEEDYGGNYVPPTPEPPSTPRPNMKTPPRTSANTQYRSPYDDTAARGSKITTIHATAQLQIYKSSPEKFEEAANIAEHLRERRMVILNLEKANKDHARRLIDFLGGVTYALNGKMQPVAVNTYFIIPYNMDIISDIAEELENSGLYF